MSKIPKPIYFDNHATTPVDPQVLEAMLPYFCEDFGNPGSQQHSYGWKAKGAVDQARSQIAQILGAEAQEIIFTSGATESIHLAILGALTAQKPGRHIVTAASEHKATLEVCAKAKALGHEVTILPVDKQGCLSVEQVRKALRPETVLVSLMHANNEIGTIHPIAEIGKMLRTENREILFHVDAAQTVGKIPLDVQKMEIDLLSISAHKLYGPKGSGALFVRKKTHLTPYIVGGGQERGLRGGTLNVPGIVGLGTACAVAQELMTEESARLAKLRDLLVTQLRDAKVRFELNGHPTDRLCNNVNVTIFGIGGDDLLLGLNQFAFSSASACTAGAASHVLQAIGQVTDDPESVSVRFGLGRFTTRDEVEKLTARVILCLSNVS